MFPSRKGINLVVRARRSDWHRDHRATFAVAFETNGHPVRVPIFSFLCS